MNFTYIWLVSHTMQDGLFCVLDSMLKIKRRNFTKVMFKEPSPWLWAL